MSTAATQPAQSLWLTREMILARFGWTQGQFQDARASGFPPPAASRQVRRRGVNGLPEIVGVESVWAITAVENWVRTLRELVQRTREFRG